MALTEFIGLTFDFSKTGVDGIMGFAYDSLSSWQGSSAFDTLVNTYNFYNGFSMCLRPQGGALTLGVDYSKVRT